jgi:hypothetical protein
MAIPPAALWIAMRPSGPAPRGSLSWCSRKPTPPRAHLADRRDLQPDPQCEFIHVPQLSIDSQTIVRTLIKMPACESIGERRRRPLRRGRSRAILTITWPMRSRILNLILKSSLHPPAPAHHRTRTKLEHRQAPRPGGAAGRRCGLAAPQVPAARWELEGACSPRALPAQDQLAAHQRHDTKPAHQTRPLCISFGLWVIFARILILPRQG